jgi:glycosyltransferase involved in cell wall biosynthesis
MRILVVSSKYQPEYSGSGLRAHNTYKRFRRKFSIEFDVVSSSLENTGVKRYLFDEVEVCRISGIVQASNLKDFPRKIVIWLNLPFEFYRSWLFIKNSVDNYDLLHTFGDSWAVGFLTWYFAKKKKPVVRELCNESPSPFFPKRFSMFIKPLFLNNNKSKIVAISPKLELMAQRHGVKSIWQRPNPVNFLRYSLNNRVNKLKLRNKLTKFSDNDIVLLNVGMFWKNKNQRFLIKLLSNLEYKYKLILIGVVKKEQENYYQQVITDIKKMSLEDRVEIVSNFINNPYDYMSLSDVYLFPSRHEGLGTPILEAQACGIPVVANDLPGVTDAWVKEGVGGYSCKLDLKLWSKAIMNASNIPENTLNKNSNYILRKSSSSVIDKKYFEIFNKLTR